MSDPFSDDPTSAETVPPESSEEAPVSPPPFDSQETESSDTPRDGVEVEVEVEARPQSDASITNNGATEDVTVEEVPAEGVPAEDESPEAGSDAPWRLLLEGLDAQEALLTELRRDFQDFSSIDQHKQAQIDRLHRELQEHKRGLLARAQRPMLSGLVRLHDALGRMAEAVLAEPAATPDDAELRDGDIEPEALPAARVREILEGFQDDVEILLDDQGVQLFRVAQAHFDPHRQSVLRGIPTDHEAQINQIYRRVRPGFEQDGTVLQKERVDVYYRAAEPTEIPHS